jgi:hypothetical protein
MLPRKRNKLKICLKKKLHQIFNFSEQHMRCKTQAKQSAAAAAAAAAATKMHREYSFTSSKW